MVCKLFVSLDRHGEHVEYCAVPERDIDGKCVCVNAGPLVESGGVLRIGCKKHGVQKPYDMWMRCLNFP